MCIVCALSGDYVVPVADCGREQFSAHPKSEMKMADYLKYWRSLLLKEEEQSDSVEGLLYLKDWHLAKYVGFKMCIYIIGGSLVLNEILGRNLVGWGWGRAGTCNLLFTMFSY